MEWQSSLFCPAMLASCIAEMRSAELVFSRGVWSTRRIQPTVGLRQGCSLSPMVFKCALEDVMRGLPVSWAERGLGVDLNGDRVVYLCLADDTWLFAKSAEE